jgi:hypothetical protein
MPWSNDGLLFLFAYLSCSCHNIDLGYLLYTTPTLSQHNWLAQRIKKEWNSTNLLLTRRTS